MDSTGLFENIRRKKSFLCVGLDSEIGKIPEFLHEEIDPVFEFNKRIVDATHSYTVAYKPNIAFYESNGADGWSTLEKTVCYIKENYYPIFLLLPMQSVATLVILQKCTQKHFLANCLFDALTVAPYMGEDSVTPFLSYPGKWVILLALTSNKGADDFQYHTENGERLFEKVLSRSQKWGNPDNMMFVVGGN